MESLILEGGTFRPIFSEGVMAALLEEEILFPYCIGVSAGICNAISYISKQPKRNLELLLKYRNDSRYFGKRNYLRCRSIFNLDFVFGDIVDRFRPFDWETYFEYEGKFLVGVTNVRTGKAEYLDGRDIDKKFTMLRATCAMPIIFPAIALNEEKYLDGGLTDPIPIRKAIKDGNQKHLIVLTRPKGYKKVIGTYDKMAAKMIRLKYPRISKIILNRFDDYNETVQFCEKLEEEGKAIILRPEYPLNSFESNLDKIQASYDHGYEMAKKRMSDVINNIM